MSPLISSDRPSRYTCGWLVPNRAESLAYWLNVLKHENMRAYRLSVTGRTFLASRRLLALRTYSMEELRRLARDYWSGAVDPTADDVEVLFEGSAAVVEAVSTDGAVSSRPACCSKVSRSLVWRSRAV